MASQLAATEQQHEMERTNTKGQKWFSRLRKNVRSAKKKKKEQDDAEPEPKAEKLTDARLSQEGCQGDDDCQLATASPADPGHEQLIDKPNGGAQKQSPTARSSESARNTQQEASTSGHNWSQAKEEEQRDAAKAKVKKNSASSSRSRSGDIVYYSATAKEEDGSGASLVISDLKRDPYPNTKATTPTATNSKPLPASQQGGGGDSVAALHLAAFASSSGEFSNSSVSSASTVLAGVAPTPCPLNGAAVTPISIATHAVLPELNEGRVRDKSYAIPTTTTPFVANNSTAPRRKDVVDTGTPTSSTALTQQVTVHATAWPVTIVDARELEGDRSSGPVTSISSTQPIAIQPTLAPRSCDDDSLLLERFESVLSSSASLMDAQFGDLPNSSMVNMYSTSPFLVRRRAGSNDDAASGIETLTLSADFAPDTSGDTTWSEISITDVDRPFNFSPMSSGEANLLSISLSLGNLAETGGLNGQLQGSTSEPDFRGFHCSQVVHLQQEIDALKRTVVEKDHHILEMTAANSTAAHAQKGTNSTAHAQTVRGESSSPVAVPANALFRGANKPQARSRERQSGRERRWMPGQGRFQSGWTANAFQNERAHELSEEELRMMDRSSLLLELKKALRRSYALEAENRRLRLMQVTEDVEAISNMRKEFTSVKNEIHIKLSELEMVKNENKHFRKTLKRMAILDEESQFIVCKYQNAKKNLRAAQKELKSVQDANTDLKARLEKAEAQNQDLLSKQQRGTRSFWGISFAGRSSTAVSTTDTSTTIKEVSERVEKGGGGGGGGGEGGGGGGRGGGGGGGGGGGERRGRREGERELEREKKEREGGRGREKEESEGNGGTEDINGDLHEHSTALATDKIVALTISLDTENTPPPM